jgi:hypothetical protein
MIRNNDGAADGDGISIIRWTGVVSCVLGGGMSWKVGVAGILIWRDDDLSKAETGLLMLVGSKASGCLPCKGRWHGAGRSGRQAVEGVALPHGDPLDSHRANTTPFSHPFLLSSRLLHTSY